MRIVGKRWKDHLLTAPMTFRSRRMVGSSADISTLTLQETRSYFMPRIEMRTIKGVGSHTDYWEPSSFTVQQTPLSPQVIFSNLIYLSGVQSSGFMQI